MPQPKSNLALGTPQALLDRAISSPEGIATRLPTLATAISLRFACYSFRNKERRASTRIYDPDHPRYGISAYDHLTITVEEDPTNSSAILRIIPNDSLLNSIEILHPNTLTPLDKE